MTSNALTERYAVLDELWTRRDDADALRRAEKELADARAVAPSDAGVLWRAARFHFWQAEVLDDSRARVAASQQGWDEAERALAVMPESADARYWAAAACGTYAEAIGVLAALAKGLEAKFRKDLDWVVQRAPGYERGGPLLTLGRYWAQLPWPKRDRKKAVQYLRAALEAHPENLRARLYLADVLRTEGGPARREAARLVEEILSASPGHYDAPEEKLIQKRAKALKAEIEKEWR